MKEILSVLKKELLLEYGGELNEDGDMQKPLKLLCDEIYANIIENKSVTTLKLLTTRINKILSQFHSKNLCLSSTLNRFLKKKFERQLSFISRPGQTTIICSKEYEMDYQASYENEVDEEFFEVKTTLNEDQILHQAAGILRKIIIDHSSNFSLNSEYMSANSMNTETLLSELPQKLYKFIT